MFEGKHSPLNIRTFEWIFECFHICLCPNFGCVGHNNACIVYGIRYLLDTPVRLHVYTPVRFTPNVRVRMRAFSIVRQSMGTP